MGLRFGMPCCYLAIGREEINKSPDFVLKNARQNPGKEAFLIFSEKYYIK